MSPYTTRKSISALSEGTDKTQGSKTRRWRKESSARGTSHLPLNFKHQRMVVNAGAQLASFRARRQEATSGGVRTSRLEPPGEHRMGGRGWGAGKISSMARLLTSWPLATPTSLRDMCSRVTRSSRGKTGNQEISPGNCLETGHGCHHRPPSRQGSRRPSTAESNHLTQPCVSSPMSLTFRLSPTRQVRVSGTVMGQQLGILSNIFRARSEDFCLWGTCAQRRASNPRE